MVRMWVQILARGPIKFNTNYSPEETHEAAAHSQKTQQQQSQQAAATLAEAVAAPVQKNRQQGSS